MYFYPVRMRILITWKGTKGRGNPRKNSVENPPMLRVKNPGVENGRKSAKHKQAGQPPQYLAGVNLFSSRGHGKGQVSRVEIITFVGSEYRQWVRA